MTTIMVTPQSDIGEWDHVVDSNAVVGDDDFLNDQVQDFLFRLMLWPNNARIVVEPP